jgi:hypothetical protein
MIGFWERAFIILFMILLFRNRRIIGYFLSSALELLSEYNDQYDHGEPPTAPEEAAVLEEEEKDKQMRNKVE